MKKNGAKKLLIAVMLIIILGLTSMSVWAVEFDKVILEYQSLTMNVGETALMLPTVAPAGADNVTNKTWLSHDSEVVEVDQNGKVTAKKEGLTHIEYVISGKRENGEEYSATAQCEIIVKTSENNVSIAEGQAKQTKQEETKNDQEVIETKEFSETKIQKKEMNTQTKLILLVMIIGLIVILILIAVASDKKMKKEGKEDKEQEESVEIKKGEDHHEE